MVVLCAFDRGSAMLSVTNTARRRRHHRTRFVRRKEWRAQQAPKGRIPTNLSTQDRIHRRFATKKGMRPDLQHQANVEPLFGNAKGAWGRRQFLHQGMEKNHRMFRMDIVAHNVLRIVRHIQRSGQPNDPPRRSPNPTNPANPANGSLPQSEDGDPHQPYASA